MSDKKISIIVPIYNCENSLKKCINSILDQTYKNIELILVDDGSRDTSNFICKEFEDKDERVKLISQKNLGASVARNHGILNATGDYLMFVDADDYIEYNMLQELAKVAMEQSADFVMCGMLVDTFDREQNLVSSLEVNLPEQNISSNKDIPLGIIRLVENESISGPCCKLIRMDIVKENRIEMPPHISLQEDLYFNLKILEKTEKMCVVGGCYYHYNKGVGESVTSRYYPNKYEMTNEVHDLLLTFYKDRCKDNKILGRINFIYIKNVYAAFMNLFHPHCKLSKKEKMRAIKKISESPKFRYMIENSCRDGFKFKLLQGILKTNNKSLMYYTSKLFWKLKSKIGFKY